MARVDVTHSCDLRYLEITEEEMDHAERLNHNIATIGLSALLVWWGIVIAVDPLTIGMGAVGTGLIMLAANAARLRAGIPTKGSTTEVGIVALVWGALDHMFALPFGLSFAILLIVIGGVVIASLLKRPRTA